MDNNNPLFRTAVFGGFNKDDVIDYIEKTKNEFYSYQKQVEETIISLKKKIRDLESIGLQMPLEEELTQFEEVDTSSNANDQIMSSVTEINEATELLRKTADLLCSSLGDFIDHIAQNSVPVQISTSNIPTYDDEEAAETVFDETASESTEEENISIFDDILAHATLKEKTQEKEETSSSILDGIFSSAII